MNILCRSTNLRYLIIASHNSVGSLHNGNCSWWNSLSFCAIISEICGSFNSSVISALAWTREFHSHLVGKFYVIKIIYCYCNGNLRTILLTCVCFQKYFVIHMHLSTNFPNRKSYKISFFHLKSNFLALHSRLHTTINFWHNLPIC